MIKGPCALWVLFAAWPGGAHNIHPHNIKVGIPCTLTSVYMNMLGSCYGKFTKFALLLENFL